LGIDLDKNESYEEFFTKLTCLLVFFLYNKIMAKKILLIEDEKILSNLLAKKISDWGYEINTAYDGEEGLKKMEKERFDLILLDIVMPKMNGFEVMEKMQKNPNLKNIPVIIISNSGQPVEISEAKKLGVKDWLIKTEFEPHEVLKKVKKQIG